MRKPFWVVIVFVWAVWWYVFIFFGCGSVESPPSDDGDRGQPSLSYEGIASTFDIDLPVEAGTLGNLPDVHLLVRCSTDPDWTVYPLQFPRIRFNARIPELGDASPLRVFGAYYRICDGPIANWLVIVRYDR